MQTNQRKNITWQGRLWIVYLSTVERSEGDWSNMCHPPGPWMEHWLPPPWPPNLHFFLLRPSSFCCPSSSSKPQPSLSRGSPTKWAVTGPTCLAGWVVPWVNGWPSVGGGFGHPTIHYPSIINLYLFYIIELMFLFEIAAKKLSFFIYK